MKVFGVHFEDGAVADYRIWQPFKAMNELGLAECKHPPHSTKKIAFPIDRRNPEYDPTVGSYQDYAEWADLIVAQRMSTLPSLSIVMGMRDCFGVPVIAECDDNLMSVPPTNQSFDTYRVKPLGENIELLLIKPEEVMLYNKRKDGYVMQTKDGGFAFATLKKEPEGREISIDLLREADAVTTTTENLAEVFRDYNPYVHVIPNCLDIERWNKIKPVPHEGVRIGWFGGMQHYDDLKIIEKVVPKILDEFKDVTFVTTLAVPDFWQEVIEIQDRFKIIPFTPIQLWPEYLGEQSIDIMLVPLIDDRFNRGKSNIKLLEFGALGIPGVFSDVECYKEVPEHALGLVANSEQGWYDNIVDLIRSATLRKQLGEASRGYVQRHYDIKKHAHRWIECYQEVHKRTHRMRKKHSETLNRKVVHQQLEEVTTDAIMSGGYRA